ncbi:M23 family metallopeptidase [Allopusillimonas ginsengisoli]|nr:M23 family metallopeptidase [Allopusillimonas ginsengisoli]
MPGLPTNQTVLSNLPYPTNAAGTPPRLSTLFRLFIIAALMSLLVACGTTKPVGPGQYRVAAGDTLTKIARQHGQSVSSLMRMNNISNPNRIKVGQVLRVQKSTGSASASGSTAGSTPSASYPPPGPRPANAINLIWPADGNPDRSIKGPSPQGIFIVNKAGTPVKAVAEGKVVYAGNSLRGYGNLVIVHHASEFLSVYAHNRALAVKEGQRVKQGQRIADMGNSESKQVGLYFELRHNGKPVSALSYLPRR